MMINTDLVSFWARVGISTDVAAQLKSDSPLQSPAARGGSGVQLHRCAAAGGVKCGPPRLSRQTLRTTITYRPRSSSWGTSLHEEKRPRTWFTCGAGKVSTVARSSFPRR